MPELLYQIHMDFTDCLEEQKEELLKLLVPRLAERILGSKQSVFMEFHLDSGWSESPASEVSGSKIH